MRKVRKWGHLHPQTSTRPITLSEYRQGLRRELIVKDKALTPEFKDWGWQQVKKEER